MIVVTGANGFVGNNLVRLLLERGERVRCLVRSTSDLRSLAGLPVEIVIGDVRDQQSLMPVFAGADTVFHLAAIIAISPGRENLMAEVNAMGTRNVAEACLETGVRRLCHVSSSHALHEIPSEQVLDENQPFEVNQRMVYGRTKALGSIAVLAACERGLDAVIACPTGMIGPNDFRPSETGQSIIDYAKARVRIHIPGGYTFVDVRDVADGLVRMAHAGRTGEYYVLGGERIMMKDMVGLIGQILGDRVPSAGIPGWVIGPLAKLMSVWARLTGAKTIITTDVVETLQGNPSFSSAKAVSELGFRPRPLVECLTETLSWFKETGALR